MRRLTLCLVAIAAASAAIATTGSRSQAGIVAPLGLAADELPIPEAVQFFFGGRRFCWYNAGWRGPGWYRCGFQRRRGLGWGGPLGWRGWRRPGQRLGFVSSAASRPGLQRPKPLPGTRS
jgi:hypothetical protein